MHRNRNPCNSFLMVKMASGMDRGRVRPTTTLCDMAALLGLSLALQSWLTAYIFDIGHRVMVN